MRDTPLFYSVTFVTLDKTDRHDIAEILLEVAFNTKQIKKSHLVSVQQLKTDLWKLDDD
jgi:hypothetical protein